MKASWSKIAMVLATGFGVGYFPIMPGTVGSLWGPGLVWCLQTLFGDPPGAGGQVSFRIGIVTIVLFVIGVFICGSANRKFAKDDPGQIVFDEIAAFPIVFLFEPITWTSAIIGFVLFRIFDIFKPWPIKLTEKAGGGFGIMIDDTIAGLYAAALLTLIMNVWSTFG